MHEHAAHDAGVIQDTWSHRVYLMESMRLVRSYLSLRRAEASNTLIHML